MKYFEDNRESTEQLAVLLEELTYRDTRKAIALRAEVEMALGRPKGLPPATTGPAPSKSSPAPRTGGPAKPAANPLKQETATSRAGQILDKLRNVLGASPHSQQAIPPSAPIKPPQTDGSMSIDFVVLKKEAIETTTAFKLVQRIAEQLQRHFNEDRIQQLIRERHVHNAPSSGIQDAILEELTQLGFQNEKTGLFLNYDVDLRPDYYCPVEKTGIMVEVERGRTTPNNMDLLDLWKCHICDHASYLFLVVPKVRQTGNGGEDPQFSRVCKRLAPFFERRNYVNVDAVYLFGY